jgi:hypothetical protein
MQWGVGGLVAFSPVDHGPKGRILNIWPVRVMFGGCLGGFAFAVFLGLCFGRGVFFRKVVAHYLSRGGDVVI